MILDNDDPKTLFATAENDLDYMKVDREQAMTVHWSKALQWAQESLLCRDIFKQVCFKFHEDFQNFQQFRCNHSNGLYAHSSVIYYF